METISTQDSIKNVQTSLSRQSSATVSQEVMLFNKNTGAPAGKTPLSTDAVIDVRSGKTLREVLDYIKPAPASDLYVDMGLPSGLMWARKNIDITQQNGFAASEYQYECSFFSWGNIAGHNPVSNSAFDYNWGSGNDGPYADTPGAALTGNIPPSYDAARAACGAPWRMPLSTEFQELFDNSDFIDADGNTIASSTTNKLTAVNGITGIRLKSKINGNVLFFPCAGYGSGTSWSNRGSYGYYWSSSLNSATYGRTLNFGSGGVGPQYGNYRFYGFAVRAVQ